MSKIVIMGDLHSDFGYLNRFINKKKPDIVLCAGDFGYWPTNKNYREIKAHNSKIYWCDGNHEDFIALKNRASDEIQPNVFYKPRGSTLTLPNGQIVLFLGGALSVDRHYRVEGISWFKDEILTFNDFDYMPDPNMKVDLVISHTCPIDFNIPFLTMGDGKFYDESRRVLSHFLHVIKPKRWFFGHFHARMSGISRGYDWECHWECLDMSLNGGDSWYYWLEKE